MEPARSGIVTRTEGTRVLDWPILADDSVRDALVDALSGPNPRAQLVIGAAGLGKTTLASRVVAALKGEHTVVLPVIALKELSAVPLAAMTPALAALGGATGDEMSHRLQHLFDAVADDPSRYLLMVDDAPLLDEVSASLINQLIRTTGVRCIMTAREGSLQPDPIVRLHAEGHVHVTQMRGLSVSTARVLVERALGSKVEPHSLRRVLRIAGGNPLFLRELVRGALEREAVSESSLGLVIDDSVLPARLQEGIVSHFAGLDRDHRRVAELIAVAEPWPQSMLGERHEVDSLLELGLARRTPAGEVYLAHPLFSEALLAVMSPETLDARRTEAAERFDTTSDAALRFKVVVLRAETEQPPPADELAWAARYAHALTDHVLAVHLADLSIGLLPTFAAALVRAAALGAMKRPGAVAAVDAASEMASTDSERVLAAMEWSAHAAIRLHEPRRAIHRELELAASIVDPSARALLQADIGRWQMMIGEPPLPPPPDVSPLHLDPMATLNSATYEVMYLAQAGRFGQVRAAITRARPLAEQIRLAFPAATDLLDLFEFRARLFEAGLGAGREFAETRRRDVFSDAVGMWSYALASIALHTGDVDRALIEAGEAVEQLMWRDFSGLLDVAIALRATAAAQLGQSTLALELLGREPTGDVKAMLQRAEAQAWLLFAEGDPDGAAETIAQAGATAITMQAHALAAPTLYVAVRLGGARHVVESLRHIANTAEGEFIAAMTAHAEASARSNADALLKVAPRLAAIDVIAGAVDAATQAAWLFRSAGRRESERKATILIARWSGSVTGYRDRRFTRGSGELTEREWSIATAAAGRQRSKEIAARLGLSARTIENHLNNIYRKLGVAGRDELRDAIDEMLLDNLS
jgi:DNA-binding CsgD family transcriptional regulator